MIYANKPKIMFDPSHIIDISIGNYHVCTKTNSNSPINP